MQKSFLNLTALKRMRKDQYLAVFLGLTDWLNYLSKSYNVWMEHSQSETSLNRCSKANFALGGQAPSYGTLIVTDNNFTLAALAWERGVMENLFTHCWGLVTRKNCWSALYSICCQLQPSREFFGDNTKQSTKIIDANQMKDGGFCVTQCVCVSLPHPWYKSQ